MGWGERAARSHAMRLQREGWLARYPMLRGEGSLLVATKLGVRVTGLYVTASTEPRPTTWGHHCACAWTAAWLSVRGEEWRGPREVLADPGLHAELEWLEHTIWQRGDGWRAATHRPSLAVLTEHRPAVVEVDLQPKVTKRRIAVLRQYRDWFWQERIAGVLYVCDSTAVASRVKHAATDAGFPGKRLRIELLTTIRAQAAAQDIKQLQLPGVRWSRANAA
jgi:hypothetical protein